MGQLGLREELGTGRQRTLTRMSVAESVGRAARSTARIPADLTTTRFMVLGSVGKWATERRGSVGQLLVGNRLRAG